MLTVMEMSTLGSVCLLKLIIDYLNDPASFDKAFKFKILSAFLGLRLLSVLVRMYYDLHVYNYFRFVQTKIQCWLFDMTCDLK
jgi:hypothetical protein